MYTVTIRDERTGWSTTRTDEDAASAIAIAVEASSVPRPYVVMAEALMAVGELEPDTRVAGVDGLLQFAYETEDALFEAANRAVEAWAAWDARMEQLARDSFGDSNGSH